MKKAVPPRYRRLENAPRGLPKRGPGRPRKAPPKDYPQAVARVSRPAEFHPGATLKQLAPWSTIPADFPRFLYGIIDNMTVLDPYLADYVLNIVSLGNPGHKLYVTAPNESRADQAIRECNELAARCYPFGGGMDGLINGMFHQLARTSATCVEWVPDRSFAAVQQAFIVPIKTLHFRYADDQGNLELCQMRTDGKLVPLLPVQTSYHGLVLRDSNPYPIPTIISALKTAAIHAKLLGQIEAWMDKASSLGVLLATLKAPPRQSGESQETYDNRCQNYLQKFADTLRDNFLEGLGVGFDNVSFQFQSTQAGAQGAKDLLQMVLQGLFAALQTDPILFGWNFGSSDTFARIVFQKMLQNLNIYRLGAKRAVEHGHRLNLALKGMGDVGVSIRFKDDMNLDRFKEAEAHQMEAQAMNIQVEGGLITKQEARRALGWEDKKVEAGAYVATFNRGENEYVKQTVEEVMAEHEAEAERPLTEEQERILSIEEKRRQHEQEQRQANSN